MRYIRMFIGIVFSVCLCALGVFAQGQGFLTPVAADTPLENVLPAGAVYEGGVVRHNIRSEQENLHLLAGYYFGNPRQWRKIYDDNRNVIKNPNRLPVGQTIQIHVGEAWRPKFSYQDWFQLATRNGEWKSGQPWQRAAETTAPASPLPVHPSPEPQETVPTPSAGGTSVSREVGQPTTENVAPVEETPADSESTPVSEEGSPPDETSEVEDTPTTEESAAEDTSDEEEEEDAPAF